MLGTLVFLKASINRNIVIAVESMLGIGGNKQITIVNYFSGSILKLYVDELLYSFLITI